MAIILKMKNTWVYFDDVLKAIPIQTYNQEHYLNNHKDIRLKEGDYNYFIKINDFRIKSNISPLSMERDQIKALILAQRKKELATEIETKMIEEAYSKGKIRTF